MYEYERMEARRNAPVEPPQNFDETEASDWFKHAKAQSGPTMVFAKLKFSFVSLIINSNKSVQFSPEA